MSDDPNVRALSPLHRAKLRLVGGGAEAMADASADAVARLMAHMDAAIGDLPEFVGGMTVALAAVLWLEGPCGGLTRAVAVLADVAAGLDDPDDDPDPGSSISVAA